MHNAKEVNQQYHTICPSKTAGSRPSPCVDHTYSAPEAGGKSGVLSAARLHERHETRLLFKGTALHDDSLLQVDGHVAAYKQG